jgi:phosphoglycerate dehydrogenase-like enzyme
MKGSAWLINTSRAGLVDGDALWEALKGGRLGGAALDVYDVEPLPLSDRFRELDNVIMTPHLGYYVVEQLGAFYQGTVSNLSAFLDGRATNLV